MSYSRCCNSHQVKNCGQGWIRPTELVRGQIYSLLPLATWLLAPIATEYLKRMSHLPESNWRPTDYKSVALPAELRWRIFVFRPCWFFIAEKTIKSYPII